MNMSIRADFQLTIDEDEIIGLLGYKNLEPTQEVLDSLREEINNYKAYIKPQIWFKKINIKSIEKNRVILDNSIVFEGEFISNKLKGCSHIIVLLSTIGAEIDKVAKSAFEDNDYLKAILVDTIGIACMEHINKVFSNSLVDDVQGTNWGITQILSPGHIAWPITEQKKIFHCFKETKLNVELLESCLMLPIKSTSAVFGFGKGIGICKLEHICSECSMQNCIYRLD